MNEAKIGHNNPPSDLDIIAEKANEKYREIFSNFENLIDASVRLPEAISDDEQAGKVGDYIKQLTGNKKKIEAARVAEKEPYLEKGRLVDAVFNKKKDMLDAVASKAKKIQAEWTRKKEEEERRKREEEAERKRQEQEEAMRKAEEAAAKAEEERKRREAAEAAARLEREKQERLKEEAAKAKLEKEEAERKAKEAKEEAEKERLKAEAAEAEAKRQKAKADEAEAREKRKAAEEEAAQAKRDERASERETNSALKESIRSEKQATKIEKNLDKDSQRASRIRGNQGSVSTVRRVWTGHVLKREELDLEQLRQHIPMEALETAVRSFIRAGGRNLKGASIYEEDEVTVR